MKRLSLILIVFIIIGAGQIFGQLSKFLTYPMEQDPIPTITAGWWYNEAETQNHSGIDYALSEGSKVLTAASGEVKTVVNSYTTNWTTPNGDATDYGNYIIIDHGDYETVYAHLKKDEILVEETTPRMQVTRGQLIALSGNTGYSTGAHLHFEVRGLEHAVTGINSTNYNGTKYDPYDIYSGDEDEYITTNIRSNYLWTTNPPSHAQYLAATYANFNGSSTEGWIAQNGIGTTSFDTETIGSETIKYWELPTSVDPYIVSSEFSPGVTTDQFRKIVVRMAATPFNPQSPSNRAEEPFYVYLDLGSGFSESTKRPQSNPKIVQMDGNYYTYSVDLNETFPSDLKRLRIDPLYSQFIYSTADEIKIDYIKLLSSYVEWDFTDSPLGWTLNNAASEGIYSSTWQINPYGSDPQIMSPWLDAVDLSIAEKIRFRMSVQGTGSPTVTGYVFFDYGEEDFQQSGDRYATISVTRDNSATTYTVDIPRSSGKVRRVRIDPFESQDGDQDKVYLYWVEFLDGNDQVIGTGTGDPSQPQNLTAQVAGWSEINLTWEAQLSNPVIYNIYREEEYIASTTDTTYDDLGLAGGTNYEYYVTAFLNDEESSASATDDATTSSYPVTYNSSGHPGGGSGDIYISSPNGGERYASEISTVINVSWEGGDSQVEVFLSLDGGDDWGYSTSPITNTGSTSFDVSYPQISSECLIKVENYPSDGTWDQSDGYFEIYDPNQPPVVIDFPDTTVYPDTVLIGLSDKISDNDGYIKWGSLTVTSVTNGKATPDTTNYGIIFNPNKGYIGPAQVKYKVKDDDNEFSDEGTISIEVIVVTSQTRNSEFNTGDTTGWHLEVGDPSDMSVASSSSIPNPTYYLDLDVPDNYGSPADTLMFSQDRLHFEAGTHRISFNGYNVLRESNVWVSIRDTSGNIIDEELASVGDKTAWNMYIADLTIPQDTVETKLFFKCQGTTSISATLRMDDIRITPIETVNILENPGFESNFDDWSKYPTSSPFTVTIYSGGRFEGSKFVAAAISSGNQDSTGRIYQTGINLAAGEYTLVFYQRFKLTAGMDLVVSLESSDGSNVYDFDEVDLSGSPATYWRKRTADLTLSESITNANLVFSVTSNTSLYSQIYLDYIYFNYDPEVVKQGFNKAAAGGYYEEPITQALPEKFELFQNYPNPFNPTTNIRFNLPEAVQTKVVVYNILGQRVAVLLDRMMDAGQHNLIWQGQDQSGRQIATGIYIYQIQAGEFITSKKMILLK